MRRPRPAICSRGSSGSGWRRCAHTAREANAICGSLVVTHPFHPLCGQRVAVLFERRLPEGRLYVCEGGVRGTIGIWEDSTDRAPRPAERPLSVDVLVELVAVVATLGARARVEGGR
jgi:hypothetical protein